MANHLIGVNWPSSIFFANVTHDSGLTWTQYSRVMAGSPLGFVGCVYGKDRWVAMYVTGTKTMTVLVSTDQGINWTSATIVSTNSTYATLTFDGTYFISSLSANNQTVVASSLDGLNWSETITIPTPGATNYPAATSYDGNIVFCNALGTRIAVSTNHGSSWTIITVALTVSGSIRLFHDGTRYFIFSGASQAYYSTDLTNWTSFSTPWAPTNLILLSSNGTRLVSVPQYSSALTPIYSDNLGINWTNTTGTVSSFINVQDLTSIDGNFLLSIRDNTGGYKTTGSDTASVTWTSFTTANVGAGMFMKTNFKLLSSLATVLSQSTISKFINVFRNALLTSISTYSWRPLFVHCNAIATSVSSYSSKKFWAFLWSIVYATNKWIGVKLGTNIASTSTDGVDWSSQSLPSSSTWAALAYGTTTAVTIAKNSNKAASTTDGATWTARTLPSNRNWTSIAANGSTFVTVALISDKCATSTDNGATWTEYSLPQESNWTSVTYGNGLFVAVCDSGITATSPDGVTWTSRAMPDSLQFNSVTWANNQFTAVASGPTNLAAKSADGITWERIYMPSAQNWTAVGPGVGNPNV